MTLNILDWVMISLGVVILLLALASAFMGPSSGE